ncbi:glycine zipper 2TM domain-containing protein [Undibacterium arcticum]|uniref:Glycine zipper 2TM domain-containing protein n=1 Tax=Undibacterium arcticum TaxID=1762892 RepID=A0ABV7F3M4_9BURK
MNVRINLLKLGALVFSSVLPFASSFAASFDDIARVINVTPNQERYVQQQQVCDSANIPVSYQGSSDRSAGGSIIGGVAGALLGNQIGGGNGRTVATAVGAIAGAMTGDRLDNRGNGYHGEPSRSCHWENNVTSRMNGYVVTYDYNGHSYTTVMPYDPGQQIRVSISVSPR